MELQDMNYTIQDIEEGIRRRTGTEHLIGCFCIKDGKSFFNDIRGGQGDVVDYPQIKDPRFAIEYNGKKKLTEGEFYSFNWHLVDKTSMVIVIDGEPQEIVKREFVQTLFEARLKLQGANLDLANSSQNSIINEVTGAQHTYIYELLQNANDYPYKNEPVSVKFILTDHYLFFLHSGDYFNLRNIVGINSIAQGEKRSNTETIGYKGIGFKTVFVNNDYVYLKSGGWSLRYDKKFSVRKLLGSCPWTLMPIPTDLSEVEAEVRDVLESNPMRVQFALHHNTNARENQHQLDKVFSQDTILLFIPNVYNVDVIIDGKVAHSIAKDDEKWLVETLNYSVPESLKKWVEDNTKAGEKIPEKFKEIQDVGISFAVAKEGDKLVPVNDAVVYSYLPTEIRLGFKFLINSNFVPNANRAGLHDVLWNDHMMEQCGIFFAEWWSSLMLEEGKYQLSSVFDILPTNFSSTDKYTKIFLTGFRKRIQEIPCIPTLRDGYHLETIENTINDTTGIIATSSPVLTDDEFYLFSDTNGCLPHPDIRCHQNLTILLKELRANMVFNGVGLDEMCLDKDFHTWLSKTENNIRFLSFLIDSDFINNEIARPIFLTEDGQIQNAGKIHYNIDNYIGDIDFLASDLPRLNVSVRNALEQAFDTKWTVQESRFKPFEPYKFANSILLDIKKYIDKLTVSSNNVHFIHFLAISGYPTRLPEAYPLVLEDGSINVGSRESVFLSDEVGRQIASHKWLDKEWVKFIAPDYFNTDAEKVKKFFRGLANISELTTSHFLRSIVGNETFAKEIANNIKDETNSVDFYTYLADSQDEFTKWSGSIRSLYTVQTTDGKTIQWTPVSKTIFWNDEDWQQVADLSWMPEGLCLSISSIYFEDKDDETKNKLNEFFKLQQIVHSYSVASFAQSVFSNISAIIQKLSTKELSYLFLDFLFENRAQLFKDENNYTACVNVPVFCKGKNQPISLSSSAYQVNQELLDLYNQPWINQSELLVCDEAYELLFDGNERKTFFDKLGIKRFVLIDYLREHLLPNLSELNEEINTFETNVSFHHYFADLSNQLSEQDCEPIKAAPIFISTPSGIPEIMDSSDDHYLPSEVLTEIINEDLVPIAILDSLHPRYIRNDSDKQYFMDKLGNVELNVEDNFVSYINKKADVTKPYLEEDDNRNIRFWRWAARQNTTSDDFKLLSSFPLLGYTLEDNGERFVPANELYITGVYSKLEGIEKFVSDYVEKPMFVSSRYKMDNDNSDWEGLFKAIGLTVDFRKIVFSNILEDLDEYKNETIVRILSKYTKEIERRLNDNEGKIKCQLKSLQLLCADGNYRSAQNVIVIGQYFSYNENPLPAIAIDNAVSYEYIQTASSDEERRQIIGFIKFVGDNISENKCEDATQLRNYKFQHFIGAQEKYANSDNHFAIIAQIAQNYSDDIEGFGKLVDNSPILLKTTKGELKQPSDLYLSSIYGPDCDYMGHGIRSLSFVNERYHDYASDISQFFKNKKLGIRHTFNSSNLEQLTNRSFAIYFWETYAPSHQYQLYQFCDESHLRDLKCLPTASGIKKPRELYDYRINGLSKIVHDLDLEEQRLPSVKLPDWIGKIGLRPNLFLPDCIKYLELTNIHYRKDVLDWIIGTSDDVISIHSDLIDDYIESALWINGQKEWVPLKDLVALEPGNATLKGNFSGNIAVCSPSQMPESITDYERLCDIFKIPILTNEDFHKKKEGKCNIDQDFIIEARKKLIYLAWKSSGKNDWKEILSQYLAIFDNAEIVSCEAISYFYNDTIKTNLLSYAETADALWYVGAWNGPMFMVILNWIKTKVIGKNEFDDSFLQNLFLQDFTSFVEEQEGGKLPNDVLELLSETERKIIREDENAHAAEFDENDMSSSDLPVVSRDTSSTQTDESQFEDTPVEEPDEQETPDEDNDATQDAKSAVPSTAESSRSERSSSSSRSSSNSGLRSTRTGERQSPSSIKTDNKSEPQPNVSVEKKKTALERFREELSQERQRTVKRPHSSGMAPGKYEEIPDEKDTNKETNQIDSFFRPIDKSAPARQDTIPRDNTRMQDTFKRRDTEAQNAAQEASDNFDLFDAFSNAPKYSFFWFELLIRLQRDKDKQKEVRRTCEIYFKEYQVIAENEDKVNIKLSNTASLIPSWIEYSDSTELSCIKSSTVLFKASIIGHDELSIDIQMNSNDVQLLAGAKKICVRAENRNNFIDSLATRFIQLEYEENYNLADNLPENIIFVYGPPGTGKTTRLVELIDGIIKESGDDRINILVLTPTNKAADVIAKKIALNKDCSRYLSRFGYSEDKFLIEDFPVVMTRDTMEIDFFEKNIMVSTAARFAYDSIQPDDTPICEFSWDYIVIDEASMMDLVTITYVLHMAKSSKFIIAGDPKQIQPFEDKNNFAENIYNMVGLDEFADAMKYERYKVETLDVQHRSTPIIGNIVSQFAYNGLLKNDPNRDPQKPMVIDGIETNDINFVGFKIEELDRLYGRSSINNSAFHLYSAIFTYNMVDYVAKQLEKNNPEIEYSIGIVCPYGAQAAAISQLIDNRPLDNSNCSIHYGTVHKFQGDECDIMFVVLNPPQIVSRGTHINNLNIVNVAMSRARDYLFFVIPEKPVNGLETRETIGNLVDEKYRSILHCADIEKTIFGKENFIYENTNVMTHLPVNVYFNTHAKYEVRIDDNTLDIQIND